jgi:hypothetical protein
VVNFIRGSGVRSDDDADNNWPLYGTDQWNKIKRNWSELVELTDSYYGLIEEMVSAECITYQHGRFVESQKEHSERNRKLFEIVSQRSMGDYHSFINCLLKTNQRHVACLLEPDMAGHALPLALMYKNRLRKNYSALVDNIEIEYNALLDLLFNDNCLTHRQSEAIKSVAPKTNGIKELIDILIRGSQQHFDIFIKCLKQVGQQHLCELLENDVCVAELDACLTGTENLEQTESTIVHQFKKLLTDLSTDQRQRVVEEINDLLKDFETKDVKLLAMKTEHSIRLYFICRSWSGVQHLKALLTSPSEDLRVIMQRFFRLLSQDINVTVDKVKWNETNYNDCENYFASTCSAETFSG